MQKGEISQTISVLDPLLDEKQVARILRVSVALTRRWRRTGEGPTWIRVGRQLVRYRPEDIRGYIESAGGKPTAA